MRPTISDTDIPCADSERVITCFIPWVQRIANRYRGILQRSAAIDMDDLIQVGIMGLLAAQQNYKPEAGKSFLGFSRFYIMNAMRRELGFNSTTGELPLVPASLDKPIRDGEDMTLADTVADDDSETPTEAAERQERADELHRAVDDLKSQQQRDIIQAVYFREEDRREAAEKLGISYATLSAAEHRALSKLRRDEALKRLCAPTFSSSLGRFRRTFSSAVEAAVLWKEREIDDLFGEGSYMMK